MSQTWPSTLPGEQFQGISETQEPNAVVTQMGDGPPKMRPKVTRPRKFQTFIIALNGSELEDFKTFFNDTLAWGTLDFEWVDAITDETVNFRFKDATPPKIDLIVGAPDPDDRVYELALALEIL